MQHLSPLVRWLNNSTVDQLFCFTVHMWTHEHNVQISDTNVLATVEMCTSCSCDIHSFKKLNCSHGCSDTFKKKSSLHPFVMCQKSSRTCITKHISNPNHKAWVFPLDTGRTINLHVNKETVQRLLHLVHEKRWDLWQELWRLFYHDHVPAHIILSIGQFLAKQKLPCWNNLPTRPTCDPTRSSPAFFFFNLRGNCSDNRESFQKSIEAWQGTLGECDWFHGDYFKGEKNFWS